MYLADGQLRQSCKPLKCICPGTRDSGCAEIASFARDIAPLVGYIYMPRAGSISRRLSQGCTSPSLSPARQRPSLRTQRRRGVVAWHAAVTPPARRARAPPHPAGAATARTRADAGRGSCRSAVSCNQRVSRLGGQSSERVSL
ncbi:hypothetical protein GGX14DRAFT_396682 [Mycena pura]|uniref:Uncharacterized protein n=1 Tax=Mycena pura TaxID=153505 RepID=A0AAD6VAF6_9AGAR|nr:hypothetical protein GGX14DRAFT_396682 [Mycena pura]